MDLSIREKICQSIIIKAEPEKHIKMFGSIENFMKQYPVGGIFVGGEICPYNRDRKVKQSIISEYEKYSKIPLLVCMDGENGVFSSIENGTEFPNLLCVGATEDKECAYSYSAAIAKEIAGNGINWTFAPVSDLSVNHQNLLITQRVLGDSAEKASQLLPELIRGYHENGLLCTAKHFPGDGVDYRNQHIVKSENSLSREEWMKSYGRMFKTAIEAGVDAVMAGHISCPALQNDMTEGMYPPATLSYDLITKVLKEELGFSGVVVSDALDMGGFLRWIYEQDEAEVKCYEVGCDMLLWPQLRVVEHIEKKVADGEIPLERVEDAYSRILNMKKKIVRTEKCEGAGEYAKNAAYELARKGITPVRNSLIPINSSEYKKVRIVGISTDDCSAQLNILKEEFEKRGTKAEVYETWCNYHADFSTIDKDYDLLVFAYMLDSENPSPTGKPAVTIHTSMIFDRDKTVVASFGSPYILKQYCETAKTYINAYKNEASLRTFVSGLYGEVKFEGKSPVKIMY